MAGRALAFSDAEIVRMATEDYVPVTGDDWYERRRDDAAAVGKDAMLLSSGDRQELVSFQDADDLGGPQGRQPAREFGE